MNRRELLLPLLAGAITTGRGIRAQQAPAKIPRIGILTVEENDGPKFNGFRAGLRDLGYIEGRNIILEFRFLAGDLSRVSQLAADLVALPVDVIVAEGTGTYALDPSGRIPVVSPVLMDPVERGFAQSLAHPGGNITGFTLMHTELNAKRLELLHTAFPHITTVTALRNPASQSSKLALEQTETAAQSMGLASVRRVEAGSAAALGELRPAVFSGADAVVIIPDGMFYVYRRDVVALINAARLPAIYPEREYADEGGLMAYGTNVPDNLRRAASYVGQILKGAKAGDLPIQEPVRFDFVVNLKTAKALGLTVPPSILARADEVIE